MAFPLKDIRFTTRRQGDGDPVLYPRVLRDHAALPKIGIAIGYFESMLGRERQELDTEVLVQFFADHKLARCVVAALSRSYRYRSPGMANVVTRASLRRLEKAGLDSPKLLRLQGCYVSDEELWRRWQDAHDTAQVSFVAFDPDRISDSAVRVSDDEIRAFYDTHKKTFEAILDNSIEADDLAKLAEEFDGYEITGSPASAAAGKVVVIVTDGENHRKVFLKRDHETWKVVDYGGKVVGVPKAAKSK